MISNLDSIRQGRYQTSGEIEFRLFNNVWLFWTSALRTGDIPVDMTIFTRALTTFAFYEATIPAASLLGFENRSISIPSVGAMSFVAFVDGAHAGEATDRNHGHGDNLTYTMQIGGVELMHCRHLFFSTPNRNLTEPLFFGLQRQPRLLGNLQQTTS
jgi:hypothetical protein